MRRVLLWHSLLLPLVKSQQWRDWAREVFVDYITGLGCAQCGDLMEPSAEFPFHLSSNIFGCADVDVLLPSLHWLYETSHHPGRIPGILVDGGANVGRASARWVAAFGDSFGRQLGQNATTAPCVVCSGASANARRPVAPEHALPTVLVVAVEPSRRNYELLTKHAREHGWGAEGFLALEAALGATAGRAQLAVREDFAIDEVATLLWEESDPRPKQPVEVVTLKEVLSRAQSAFPLLKGADRIFLLKLDIEGLEPLVLRSLTSAPVKFVSFEYAANVWKEPLAPVVEDLHRAGYFCFLITSEHLFPVSGPFWSNIFELPMWSNFICGKEGDRDLEALVQLHVGAIGLWPRMPKAYLPDFSGEGMATNLLEAQHWCTDFGDLCAGVTCDGDVDWRVGPQRCTARRGRGTLRQSPTEEVSYLKDVSYSNLYLRYRLELQRELLKERADGWSPPTCWHASAPTDESKDTLHTAQTNTSKWPWTSLGTPFKSHSIAVFIVNAKLVELSRNAQMCPIPLFSQLIVHSQLSFSSLDVLR
ncbi:Ubiquitin-like domain-containing protein [Durusdinium trenchii]|uniref:Ubiquitin-like domain-containing protein n=1 Tax=Durusdinium trenchii TaxID=1381693 RepID=A0ABP0PPR8_9DINO